jgi:hypothetical protein
MMRYLLAFAISLICIGGWIGNHVLVTKQLTRIEQQAERQFGRPPGSAPSYDYGVDLPPDLLFRVQLDHVWPRWWCLIVPLIAGICFGVAALLPRRRRAR